jgi:hypothetical protein
VKAIRRGLSDRQRSQRGSVLSGVLIIVMFLSVISGALMTALSTNFLLSSNLSNRVQTEATVSSAAELALNQLKATPISAGCSKPTQVSVNGQTAAASVLSCASVIDRRSPQGFTQIASSNPFRTDGTLAQPAGLNDYLVGDSGGTVLDYTFGQTTARWKVGLDASVTATPLAMADPGNGGQYLDLVPASGPVCQPAQFCLSVLSDNGSRAQPRQKCIVAAQGQVVTQPAVGRNNPRFAFAGDTAGRLYAVDTGGNCDVEFPTTADGPIVSGPFVFPCSSGCGGPTTDWVFVISSSGGSSELEAFTFSSDQFRPAGGLSFNLSGALGVDLEATTLPSRIAITFAGGQVALVQIDGSGNMTSPPLQMPIQGGISGAPFWCHCPGSPANLIGVGGNNGNLYLYQPDLNMSLYAKYAGGYAIRTAPSADAAGNWYFAADDGRLYEVQNSGGPTMTLAATFGSGGPFRSSPVLGPCQQDICIYLASTDARAYLVDLDARDVLLRACIGTVAAGCSPGLNPRLWTSVEIGVANNPQAVHVQVWSYYSG